MTVSRKIYTIITIIFPLMIFFVAVLSSCSHYNSVEPGVNTPYSFEDNIEKEMVLISDIDRATDSMEEIEQIPDTPLSLTLESAILTALKNNASFKVDRLSPEITRTGEDIERAVFDPVFSASANTGQTFDDNNVDDSTTSSLNAEATIKKGYTSGTALEVGLSQDMQSAEDDSHTRDTDLDVTVTQALLKGKGTDVNLARVRQAKIDTRISEFELQGAAETLVAITEEAYWDYILAERSIVIYEESLKLAKQQLDEVAERIKVGKIPETELIAAEAEVASRQEQLIDAKGIFQKKRLELLRILNLPGDGSVWDRKINPTDTPELPEIKLDTIDAHLDVALKKRPDLNQAHLQIKRGDLEIVRTKNGLLPKLDLFVRLGGSLYADSFSESTDKEGDESSYVVGIDFELPLGRRADNARYKKAMLEHDEAEAALYNMEQLVQVDVRSAYIDVESAAERVKATKATRELREKTLDTEEEKFRVGRSTAFLVSQARRDMVSSQINEIESIIEYRKAILKLYRLEGSLLARWGIKHE